MPLIFAAMAADPLDADATDVFFFNTLMPDCDYAARFAILPLSPCHFLLLLRR